MDFTLMANCGYISKNLKRCFVMGYYPHLDPESVTLIAGC